MANNPKRLINSFIAINGAGKQQTAWDTPMLDADLNYRLKAAIEVSETVDRTTIFDCEGRDIDDEAINTRLKRFTLTMNAVTSQILALFGAYYFGTAAAPTGTPANEVQTLTRTGTVSGGIFTISLTMEGRTGLTAAIAWNATISEIGAALIKTGTSIGKLIKAGDVAVTGDWTTGIVLTFQGRLANADLPLVVIDATNLTGTTPGIAVAGTTAGANKFHALTRSTSDVKPKFSFALGYKNSGLATEKYYNGVVETFNPTLNRGGDVSLTVGIIANYEPLEVAGFVVPACENFAPLKTSDCRVRINSNWETLDIFSESYTLNDNVPVDADTFGFDSTDPDALERGDNPSYQIAAQIFGAKGDALDIIAAAENKVEYITHFGMPGTRFSLISGNTKIKKQANSRQHAGARNRSVIAIDATPHRDSANPPIRAEAHLSQTTAFLLT